MNNSPNSQMLTIWGFVFVLLGAILYLVSKGLFVYAGIVVGLISFLILAHSPGKWWLAAVLLANSGVLTPGFGTNLTASLAVSLGFIGFTVMDRIFRRSVAGSLAAPQRIAAALVILLIFLASYRGWGLQKLGSASWGGMQYIQLIIGLLFFFFSQQVNVDEKDLKRVITLYFALTLLPVAITVLSRYIPVLMSLGAIFNIEDTSLTSEVESGVRRVSSMNVPAVVLGYLALLMYDRTFKMSWKIVGVGLLSFILIGISGHRVALSRVGLVTVVYIATRWRKIPMAQRIKGAAAGVCLLGVLYGVAPQLPLAYQRALSILPGIKANYLAAEDASGTSSWRIEMWRQMLPMIPDYLAIGRGLGYDLREAYGAYILASDRTTAHAFFIAVHNYHNGPLWALIDLGGPGAVLIFGFMILSIVRYGRRVSWSYSPFMGSAYVVFYSILVSNFIFFLSVFGYYGDVVTMAMTAAILEVVSEQARGNNVIASKPVGRGSGARRFSRGDLPSRDIRKIR